MYMIVIILLMTLNYDWYDTILIIAYYYINLCGYNCLLLFTKWKWLQNSKSSPSIKQFYYMKKNLCNFRCDFSTLLSVIAIIMSIYKHVCCTYYTICRTYNHIFIFLRFFICTYYKCFMEIQAYVFQMRTFLKILFT